MAVLDLARMARPDVEGDEDKAPLTVKAVASLHGILAPILPGAGCKVSDDAPLSVPRVLVLHATADPFVPPDQVRYRELYMYVPQGANPELDMYGVAKLGLVSVLRQCRFGVLFACELEAGHEILSAELASYGGPG